MENYGKTIADFVIKYRKYCDYSQPQFAKWVGFYTGQQVSNIERGVHPRPLSFCRRLLKRLDKNRANWLLELIEKAILEDVDDKLKKKR